MMTETTEHMPVLKFSGFEESWDLRTIQSLLDDGSILSHLDGNHGELYPRADEFSAEGVPYIAANDFVDGQVNLTGCKFLPPERAAKFRKGVAKDGDVLFAHNATVGPTAILRTELPYVILSTTATYYRCDPDSLARSFLRASLQADYFVRQYTRVMSQSTRNQVPISMQRRFHLQVPTLPEQRKIADFLTAVDERIQQLIQKRALLEDYKKGVMQQLFTQAIRFQDDRGNDFPDWEETTIGEVGRFYYGKSAPKFSLSEDAPTPCVRYGELYSEYSVVIGEIKSKTNIDPKTLKFSEGGEILVPRVGEDPLDFAKCCCLLPQKGVAIGEMISVFNTKENPLFYTYYFRTLSRQFARMVEGASVSNLYFRYLEPISIFKPYLDEQAKIADFLSAIDRKIDSVATQITETQTFKRGLLQQMFV